MHYTPRQSGCDSCNHHFTLLVYEPGAATAYGTALPALWSKGLKPLAFARIGGQQLIVIQCLCVRTRMPERPDGWHAAAVSHTKPHEPYSTKHAQCLLSGDSRVLQQGVQRITTHASALRPGKFSTPGRAYRFNTISL